MHEALNVMCIPPTHTHTHDSDDDNNNNNNNNTGENTLLTQTLHVVHEPEHVGPTLLCLVRPQQPLRHQMHR